MLSWQPGWLIVHWNYLNIKLHRVTWFWFLRICVQCSPDHSIWLKSKEVSHLSIVAHRYPMSIFKKRGLALVEYKIRRLYQCKFQNNVASTSCFSVVFVLLSLAETVLPRLLHQNVLFTSQRCLTRSIFSLPSPRGGNTSKTLILFQTARKWPDFNQMFYPHFHNGAATKTALQLPWSFDFYDIICALTFIALAELGF